MTTFHDAATQEIALMREITILTAEFTGVVGGNPHIGSVFLNASEGVVHDQYIEASRRLHDLVVLLVKWRELKGSEPS